MTFTMVPTTPTDLTLTSRNSAVRAVNQLLSVVVGRDTARATDYLKDDPAKRVQESVRLTMEDYQSAMTNLANDPDAHHRVKQVQRKLDSLSSLQVISNLLNETEW